jgi:hypothetical protein
MRRLLYGLLALALLVLGYWFGRQDIAAALPAAAQHDCQTFPETGKTVCGIFLHYWRTHGGLAQQGLPITDVFQETSRQDGKVYDVQYFERAVFERHPEHAGTPYEVLLSLVGRETFERQYPAGLPSGETPLRQGQTLTLAGTAPNTTFRTSIAGIVERKAFPATPGCVREPARGTFVAMLLDVENVGSQPSRIRVPRIRDEGGRDYFEVDDTCPSTGAEHLLKRKPSVTELQPGAREAIVIVYDVTVSPVGAFTLVPTN